MVTPTQMLPVATVSGGCIGLPFHYNVKHHFHLKNVYCYGGWTVTTSFSDHFSHLS